MKATLKLVQAERVRNLAEERPVIDSHSSACRERDVAPHRRATT